MNFIEFSEKVQKEIFSFKSVNNVKVQVLDRPRTQLNGGPVAVNVTGVGYDENSQTLYIEITDNIAE